MRLDEVTPLLTAVATPRLTATLSAWRPGQVLHAEVARIISVGTATLNVNNISLDIRSELPLFAGQRLLLEVAQIGAQITLRVVAPAVPKDTVAAALRVLAPRQSELTPVLTELLKITLPGASQAPPAPTGGTAIPAPLTILATPLPAPAFYQAQTPLAASLAAALAAAPQELRDLAKNIIERIRTPAQTATPEGMKQAIKSAGPFFEHELATASGNTDAALVFGQDLKAGLLKLVSYLRTALPPAPPAEDAPSSPPAGTLRPHAPAPATQLAAQLAVASNAPLEILAKEADAALARITTQQLLSLPEHGADPSQWIFDLPLRHGERVDVFHLHVFREKHARDSKQPPAWCVRLSFDLITLGKVDALVTLFADSVSVSLWAQQNDTARLFEQHLADLRSGLQEAGIVINRMHCECGDAPFTGDTPLKQKRDGLIDERA